MRAIVTAETALHLREAPSKASRVVNYLRNGDLLETFGQPDRLRWQMVRSERLGQYGYVDADFIAPAPAPAPAICPAPKSAPATEPKAEDHRVFWAVLLFVVAPVLIALFWTLGR